MPQSDGVYHLGGPTQWRKLARYARSCVRHADAYNDPDLARRNEASTQDPNNLGPHLANEFARRMGQLDWLCRQIHVQHRRTLAEQAQYNACIITISDDGRFTPEQSATAERYFLRTSVITMQHETLVEAFYYYAHRVLKLIEWLRAANYNGLRSSPRIDARVDKSIKITRNKLIEHPEKEGQEVSQEFAWHTASGIQLKPCARNFRDEGYLRNAMSFFAEVERVLGSIAAAKGVRRVK